MKRGRDCHGIACDSDSDRVCLGRLGYEDRCLRWCMRVRRSPSSMLLRQ